MILVFFIGVFLAAASAMFSAESLVSTLIGGAVSIGLTQFLKKFVGMNGAGATIVAFLVSLLVAIAALVISAFVNDGGFSYDKLPAMAGQVFALATLAYNIYTKSQTPADGEVTTETGAVTE